MTLFVAFPIPRQILLFFQTNRLLCKSLFSVRRCARVRSHGRLATRASVLDHDHAGGNMKYCKSPLPPAAFLAYSIIFQTPALVILVQLDSI